LLAADYLGKTPPVPLENLTVARTPARAYAVVPTVAPAPLGSQLISVCVVGLGVALTAWQRPNAAIGEVPPQQKLATAAYPSTFKLDY